MNRPLFSVGGLAAVVISLAAGCLAIQAMYSSASVYADEAVAVLPMAGILLIGLTVLARKLARRGEHVTFLVGFETFGWAAILVLVLGIVLSPPPPPPPPPPDVIEQYRRVLLFPVYRAVFDLGGIVPGGGVHEPLRRLCIAVVFTLPLMLVALIGGGMSNMIGISVVIRKPAPQELTMVKSRP